MQLQPGPFATGLKTEFAGLSVKFSPFEQSIQAMACAENFGIVGKGKLLITQVVPNGVVKVINDLNEKDAVFDCAWSETIDSQIVTACGNGQLNLWDLIQNRTLLTVQAHKSECYSVECSHKAPQIYLSSGFDGQVKVWDMNLGKQLESYQAHQGIAYQATWHPVNDSMFATVGQDGFMKIWDLKSPQKNILNFRAHEQEILSCDFNKYNETIVTGSIDKTIRLWDLRNLKVPVQIFIGHRYPVRKVKCSPHEANIIASGSYDMNVNIWEANNPQSPLLFQHSKHTEFVLSVDFNLYNKGQIASTGYDGRLFLWPYNQSQPHIP